MIRYNAQAPQLKSFKMIYRNQTYDLLDTSYKRYLTWVPGNPYTLIAEFDNSTCLSNVYFGSTRSNVTAKMDAQWDSGTNTYMASGYFNNDSSYVPGVLNVYYNNRAIAPDYSESSSWTFETNDASTDSVVNALSNAQVSKASSASEGSAYDIQLPNGCSVSYVQKNYSIEEYDSLLERDAKDFMYVEDIEYDGRNITLAAIDVTDPGKLLVAVVDQSKDKVYVTEAVAKDESGASVSLEEAMQIETIEYAEVVFDARKARQYISDASLDEEEKQDLSSKLAGYCSLYAGSEIALLIGDSRDKGILANALSLFGGLSPMASSVIEICPAAPAWSGSLFRQQSTTYDQSLASVCADMSGKIENDSDSAIRDLLVNEYGFDGYEPYRFGQSGAFVVGHDIQKVRGQDTAILVVVARGTLLTQPAEWIGDFFKNAPGMNSNNFFGHKVYNNISEYQLDISDGVRDYLNKHPEVMKQRKVKVLVTGHSLGGAAANLYAAEINNFIDSGSWQSKVKSKSDVYAYTFGAIKVLSSETGGVEEGYENIHNLYNYYDYFGPNGDFFLSHPSYGTVSSPYAHFGHTDIFDIGKQGGAADHEISFYKRVVDLGYITCVNKKRASEGVPVEQLFAAMRSTTTRDIMDLFGPAACLKETPAGGVGTSVNWAIDPSGYVYEGVVSNRVEGVKTTVYYKEDENAAASEWDASEYDQANPLYTDADGMYRWDVPEGYWRVKFEKDGYETAYSDWMEVPPVRTDVNMGMVATAAPELEYATVTDSGVKIAFTQYMDPTMLSGISLKDPSGNELRYTLLYEDNEKDADGKVLAKAYTLLFPGGHSVSKQGDYTIAIPASAKNYAGKSANATSYSKSYEPERSMKSPKSVTVAYGDEADISFTCTNFTGEEAISIVSGTDDIAAVVASSPAGQDGKIRAIVEGNMVGKTNVAFSVAGTDVAGDVEVNVVFPDSGTTSRAIGPQGFTAACEDGKTVSLSWDAADDANGYEVYRSDENGGAYLMIGTTESPSYSDEPNPGDFKYRVRAFTGSGTECTYTRLSEVQQVSVTPQAVKPSLENAQISVSRNNTTYTGNALTPAVTVMLDGKTLTRDTDYEVAYANNTNAGDAQITVTGKGDYEGSKSETFKISAASISSASITALNEVIYNGKAQTPAPTVTLNGSPLKSGTDYTVAYKDNINVGTATVTVTGKGNYTGSKSVTFKIVAASAGKTNISKAAISGLKTKTYNGKAQTQSPVVKVGSKTLKSGTDYTVSYKNNTKAGTATVVIAGKGSYTGTKTATFKINKAKQLMTVKATAKTVKAATAKKKAVAIKKPITVKKNQGKASYKNVSKTKKLKKFKINAKNGTITVPKGTKKGTYKIKVKVTAKGNANYKSGSKTATAKIVVK